MIALKSLEWDTNLNFHISRSVFSEFLFCVVYRRQHRRKHSHWRTGIRGIKEGECHENAQETDFFKHSNFGEDGWMSRGKRIKQHLGGGHTYLLHIDDTLRRFQFRFLLGAILHWVMERTTLKLRKEGYNCIEDAKSTEAVVLPKSLSH
jgi:hypothetical protein